MNKKSALSVVSLIVILVTASLRIYKVVKKHQRESEATQKVFENAKRLLAIERVKKEAVTDFVHSLPDEVKISQLFLVNVEGNEKYTSIEKTGSLYGNNKEGSPLVPGGALLFSYNVSNDPLQTYDYIKSIHDFYLENDIIPPYVAIDQEGGDVNRLRGLTSTLWAQKKVADSFTPEKARILYSSQARQMRNLGFHMNLAPVVEAENSVNREFLGTRTFGSLENTLLYGKIAVTSYEDNGIGVVLKHFPGNSDVDPHAGLPRITFTDSDWESYFKPFEKLLPLSSAVLMSHAVMKNQKDEGNQEFEMPACFSPYWIWDVLHKQFSFNNLVISDDIFMGALAKNGYPPEKAVVKAVEAGVDVIMLSEKRFGKVAAILLEEAKKNPVFAERINKACENVINFKIRSSLLLLEEVQSEASEEKLEQKEEYEPVFSVRVNPDYAEFDLKKFDEDYNEGMNAYN